MSLPARGYLFVRGALAGASLLAATGSFACVNAVEGHTPHGSLTPIGVKMADFIRSIRSQSDINSGALKVGAVAQREFVADARRHQAALAYIREYEAAGAPQAGFAEAINYSVALMHVGRPEKAIDTLVALEAREPGAYQTATNLGTACELAGRLEEAVVWIGRGIERNPASHDGTEWLHLAILRAKLKLRDDPAWLARHSVLAGEEGRPAAEIVRAIERQLGERLQFVQPRDAAVCDLFYQAAVRVEGERAAERRLHFLRESLRFGDWRKAEAEQRLKS